ncbi:MAG: bifunctional riboflavin kinase/FAD synthetase [Ignavibacteriaceae bacterium]
MQIYYELSKVKKDKNTVLTLGTFDGVHLGHKKIIKEVIKKAVFYKSRNFLITFYPHPRSVISKDFDNYVLSTVDEKFSLLKELGIENILVIKFTKEFSQISPEDFVKKYLVNKIGTKEIIIGHDHHFGKGRGGDESTLRELGKELDFQVTAVQAVDISGKTVSSTKIRNVLSEGNVQQANIFLGRYYSFSGKVVVGDKRGRELGFPTANIELEDETKILPAIGIYFVQIEVNNNKHFGLLSIGKRPTFHNSGEIIPEVYIYDFDENIYGKNIKIELIEKLREEIKFNTADELVVQMNIDKQSGLKLIKNFK